MARLWTTGAEVDAGKTGTTASPDGFSLAGATTRDTTVFRSGLASFKFDGAAGATANITSPTITVTSLTIYQRMWVNVAAAPSTQGALSAFGPGTTGIRITTSGTLQLVVNSVTQTGTSIAITDSLWHKVEWSLTCDGSNNMTAAEFRLDDVTVATFSGTVAFGAATGSSRFGWSTNPGANKIMNMDDIAINDSSGGSQNTWCGEGRVVLLIPTADSSVGTGWTNDAAGTTNLFDAENNKPPVGIADTSSGTGLNQIRNATANANVNYDATMTTYAAAGVPFGASVNVVDPVCITAAPVTTSAKQGTVGVASNPTIANIALAAAGTSGAFWSGVTEGTYPAGWKVSHGTPTYTPTVTLATAPVMRVTQVTSSTRIAVVCFMGIYVEYAEAPVSLHQPGELALQAMNRAGNF